MGIYEDLKNVLALAFEDDDLMSQDTLFAIQDALAELTLKYAKLCHTTTDLVNSFPYLYKVN